MHTTRYIERAIIKRVIGELLASKRFSLGVHDHNDIVLRNSRDTDAILNKMFTTDGDRLLVTIDGKLTVGCVEFVYGNDGYDVISDWYGSPEWYPLIDTIITGIIESLEYTLVTE